MRSISKHLDQTSLVKKVFIIWKKNTIFLQDTAGKICHLARLVANHSAGFGSSYPLRELAIQ